jgi:hypothetical protein
MPPIGKGFGLAPPVSLDTQVSQPASAYSLVSLLSHSEIPRASRASRPTSSLARPGISYVLMHTDSAFAWDAKRAPGVEAEAGPEGLVRVRCVCASCERAPSCEGVGQRHAAGVALALGACVMAPAPTPTTGRYAGASWWGSERQLSDTWVSQRSCAWLPLALDPLALDPLGLMKWLRCTTARALC